MTTTLRLRVDVITDRAAARGDLTHHAIAMRTGLRQSTISRLVAGQTVPSLPTLAALAAAYDTTLDDLVDRGNVLAQAAA